jgi:GDPmannose 4,6-dehydratase
MLQQDKPDDYVVATGESHSLEEFVDAVFSCVGLRAADHLEVEKSLFRPSDIAFSCGNPSKAHQRLGWKARVRFLELVQIIVDWEKGQFAGRGI